MCLGIPGKILSVYEDHGTKMANIDFGASRLKRVLKLSPKPNPVIGRSYMQASH